MHLNLGQNPKFRVANVESDLILDLTWPRVFCTSTIEKSWVNGDYYERRPKNGYEKSWMFKIKS